MKNQIRYLFWACAIACALITAKAQPSQGDWEFTLGGGGDSDNEFNHGGFNLAASAGYFFTPGLEAALRQSVVYDSHSSDDSWAGSTRGAVDYNFQLGKFVPFVGGNFGLDYNERDNEWGIGPEIGAKYYVHEKTFLFAMGEYRWLFDRLRDVDNNADDGRFLFTIGIGFNIGGNH
jgi:hypothetical protein